MIFEVSIKELDMEWLDQVGGNEAGVVADQVSELLGSASGCKARTASETLELDYGMYIYNPLYAATILAFAGLKKLDDAIWELCSVVVDPDMRKQGIGKHVVSQMVAWFKENDEGVFGGDLVSVCVDSLTGYYNQFGLVLPVNELSPPLLQRQQQAQNDGKVLLVLASTDV